MKNSKGKLYQYKLDGTFLQEFENTMEAEHKLKISAGTICGHLSNKSRHCHGYLFSRRYYLRYPINLMKKKPNKKMLRFDKEFYAYDTNGFFQKKYNNLKDVSDRNDIRGWVRACLKGENKTYDNMIWLYDYYEKVPEDLLNKILNNRIVQINRYGELIEIYKNISEAARKTGFGKSSISFAVAGKRNSIYGYIFKRYSEYKKYGNI